MHPSRTRARARKARGANLLEGIRIAFLDSIQRGRIVHNGIVITENAKDIEVFCGRK